jgi:hypothetical protein
MGRPRKYRLNENYFNEINSNEKAYIVGFIFADGGIYKRYLQFSLSINDVEILEFIKKELEYDGPMQYYTLNKKEYMRLFVCSKNIVNDLKNIGIIPNKTYESKKLPQIEKKYISHFLRGFFDGDGSIYSSNYRKKPEYCVNFSNNKLVLEEIKKILLYNNISSGKIRRRYINNDISCMIEIKGNINVEKIYRLLYCDADFYLLRKHERFLKFLESLNYLDKRKLSTLIITQIKEQYLSGLKQYEIANKMFLPKSTVRGVIQRLRKKESVI